MVALALTLTLALARQQRSARALLDTYVSFPTSLFQHRRAHTQYTATKRACTCTAHLQLHVPIKYVAAIELATLGLADTTIVKCTNPHLVASLVCRQHVCIPPHLHDARA